MTTTTKAVARVSSSVKGVLVLGGSAEVKDGRIAESVKKRRQEERWVRETFDVYEEVR